MSTCKRVDRIVAVVVGVLWFVAGARAGSAPPSDEPPAGAAAGASSPDVLIADADIPPVPALAMTPMVKPSPPASMEAPSGAPESGVSWGELSRAASRFLVLEHGFRLLTEPGTRSGLKGSFFNNYATAVGNLHGWADGDEFYVNYVGHPMQGAVAGFLFVTNDRAYRHAEFGKDRDYWKSRLRAAAFAWAYSTQFEIGPLSEASIGGIQALFPQQGFVDHVITPSIGMAWMIAEDSVDRYIIKRIEASTSNRWVRLLARGGLNPSRTFANFLDGRVPWHRDTRPGVSSYDAHLFASTVRPAAKPPAARTSPTGLAAPFEFSLTFQPERFWGGNKSTLCLGGGGTAGFRLTPSWQLIAEVGGCKMLGLDTNLSGDSLVYAVGPRWLCRVRGPWTAELQFLVGGNKVTEERMFPLRKKALEAAAVRENQQPPSHDDYTEQTESNGFTIAGGGGLRYDLNRALTIRVADVRYRHSWTAPLWGRDYSNSLNLSAGLVLRTGTW